MVSLVRVQTVCPGADAHKSFNAVYEADNGGITLHVEYKCGGMYTVDYDD